MTLSDTVTLLSVQDIEAVRMIPAEWARAALARDWDRVLSLLTDDAVLLPPEQPLVAGKAAIRAWFEAFPPMKTFVAREVQTEGQADFAWSRGTFEMSIEATPGKLARIVGKWSSTARKQPDGRWLVASDTWNPDHPVAAE